MSPITAPGCGRGLPGVTVSSETTAGSSSLSWSPGRGLGGARRGCGGAGAWGWAAAGAAVWARTVGAPPTTSAAASTPSVRRTRAGFTLSLATRGVSARYRRPSAAFPREGDAWISAVCRTVAEAGRGVRHFGCARPGDRAPCRLNLACHPGRPRSGLSGISSQRQAGDPGSSLRYGRDDTMWVAGRGRSPLTKLESCPSNACRQFFRIGWRRQGSPPALRSGGAQRSP